MKTITKFDWDEMVEAMVKSALEGHKWFGKSSSDGKDSPKKALADSLEAFSEACYDRFFIEACYDRLQELSEGDVT